MKEYRVAVASKHYRRVEVDRCCWSDQTSGYLCYFQKKQIVTLTSMDVPQEAPKSSSPALRPLTILCPCHDHRLHRREGHLDQTAAVGNGRAPPFPHPRRGGVQDTAAAPQLEGERDSEGRHARSLEQGVLAPGLKKMECSVLPIFYSLPLLCRFDLRRGRGPFDSLQTFSTAIH